MRCYEMLMLVLTAVATVLAEGLSYEDSIKAIALNQVDPYDDSVGTVWFNTTGYGLEDSGFDMIGDYGIKTYSSFNYLVKLTELASEAADKGKHGDVVFLLNKFLYAGNKDATEIKEGTDMMNDISLMLQTGSPKRQDAGELTDVLFLTSSVQELVDMYQLAAETVVTASLKKKWFKTACSSAHRATRSACSALIEAIRVDVDWHSGGPRHVEYRGCVISWSGNASFRIFELEHAAKVCVSACGTARISCEVWGTTLGGTIVNQCLSNRAKGCR